MLTTSAVMVITGGAAGIGLAHCAPAGQLGMPQARVTTRPSTPHRSGNIAGCGMGLRRHPNKRCCAPAMYEAHSTRNLIAKDSNETGLPNDSKNHPKPGTTAVLSHSDPAESV